MSTTRMKGHNANEAASENLGKPMHKYTIKDVVKLVSFSFPSDSSSSHCELKNAWENIGYIHQSNIGPTVKAY